MEGLLSAVQYVLNMGSTVLLPVFVILLGLLFGMKIGKAIVSGLMVGIGLTGLNLVVGLLMNTITPATNYYTALNEGFVLAEIGWTAVAGATWAVPFAALVIPCGLLLNFLLLKLKVVNVMNVDIWNYVVFLMPGAMAYALSGSFLLGFAISVGLSVLVLLFAEWVAPKWQSYFGLEGTTCTTLVYLCFVWPIAIAVNKLLDIIPGVKKINLDVAKLSDKIGFWGNPAIIGVLVGALLGILTKQTVAGICTMAIGIAATMVLMPKMVSLMMEGLSPLGMSARNKMKEKFGPDREFLVGMDIALALGDPCAITASVICIPILILAALFLPGVLFFPTSMLTTIIYFAAIPAMTTKGNLFRTIVITVVFEVIVMLVASAIAPEATQMLATLGIETGGITWTDASFGSNPFIGIVAFLSRLFV